MVTTDWTAGLQAVVFDFGNTLIEFGPRQVSQINHGLHQLLEAVLGPCDGEAFAALRHRQVLAPYQTGYRENDLDQIARQWVHELYGQEAAPDLLERLRALRYHLFQQAVRLPTGVAAILDRLGRRHRLALLSNYPCGRAIRDSLVAIGIADRFASVVVSADLGLVKPHADLYARILKELGLPPEVCVMVGDNWLADVQGAKRAGMKAILTTQYVSYESFTPYAGDLEPDAVIAHLDRLPDILGA